jgi:hypothetical protein
MNGEKSKERRPIPAKLRDDLLAANRHTCCICHEQRHPVEKHHINGDPGDNRWDNLAILCRNCHGLVTVKGSLGAGYSAAEVFQYKQQWEQRCREAAENEIESPGDDVHETKLIEADGHETYEFDMEQGDELVFSIEANDYLDLVICDTEDIEEWIDEEHDEERPLPEHDWARPQVMEGNYKFTAPEDGRYVLLLVNWDEEPTEVTVDAAVWE